MDLGCIDMGCVEKQKKEINPEKQNSPKESVMSASKPGKSNRAKDAVRSSLNVLNKLTTSITKPPHRKTSSPLNWFPRKKVEPYLKRKIKMLQEVDGMHSTLDETLEDTNPHYSRVLREKIAIKEAAGKAMEARKAAMVEASWSRILQAARIECREAEVLLSKAEDAAAEAFEAARAVGVIMNDAENHFRIETSYSTTHTVSATFETAFEVDKQVAAAVKAAFVKLVNCSSINRDEFKELLCKISENPDSDENCHEICELNSECASETGSDLMKGQESSDMFSMASIVEMMLDRLRRLKEEELASLATKVATCGLNAALAESEDKKKYGASSAIENVKNPCLKELSRPSIGGRRRVSNAEELPSLDKFLVKRLTRLEREILEAKNARKNEACDGNQSKLDETDTSSRTTNATLKEENEEAVMNSGRSTEENNKQFQRARSKQVVEEVPSLDKFLVKRLTRLEREIQEAKCRKAFEPIDEGRVTESRASELRVDSLEKENTNLNRTDESLDKVVKHVSSKLEFGGGEQMGMKLKQKGAQREELRSEGSLDQVLVKHVSKLEKAKMEFRAGEQMGAKLKQKRAEREQVSSEGSLDQVLVKHVSKLERAKMEFHAGEGMGEKLKRNGASRELESNEGSLDQVMVKRKSRLEREKMAAAAAAEHVDDGVRHSVSRRQAREKELQEAWGGLSLGNSMQPHVSRLQRDKAAWREAEEEERKREMQEV